MNNQIPFIIQDLYSYMVTGPNPKFWPEELRDDPIRGHGLWAFYRGVRLGLNLAMVCGEMD